MKELMNHLIAEAPDQSVGVAVQVTIKDMGALAGALRLGPVADVYQLRAVMQRANTRQVETIDIFFKADAVVAVARAPEAPQLEVVGPQIIKPH